MPEIKDLTDKIQSATDALHKAADSYHDESAKFGEATGETKAKLDKINDTLDETKARLDEIGLKQDRQALVSPGEGKSSEEKERDSAYSSTYFKWAREGAKNLTTEDFKILKEALPPERKALIENTAGLYLVPQELEAEIMRAVPRPNSLRAVCWNRPTNRNKVDINSLTEVSVGWGKLETGSTPTESTMTPSQDTIYVEDVLGLSKIGKDELMDTDANLTAILADSFKIAFDNAEDTAFAVGTGHTTYSQPGGVAVNASIIASYKANWTTADTALIDDMLTCKSNLPEQYDAGASWLMARKTELAIRLLRPETASGYYGQYFWQPSLQVGEPNNFDGYPIIRQNDMNYPADATKGINVLFGNFRKGYVILNRAGITMQRLDELYAEAGQVGFIGTKRVGAGVYRAEAFYGIYNNT